ncbi:hypothetical protein [Pedobacter faecalis]|uniref:hypothetical protein n=1 Tax=Pedobacter faecalis TaxID=3041495 RepID=UPI00254B396A|nr:hypothetical protein [Pedobacter sp. ELA7]
MNTQPHDPVNPAPHVNQDGTVQYDANTGLTKREIFAAMAMQGILSDQTYLQPNQSEDIAERAVTLADALIKALNEKP